MEKVLLIEDSPECRHLATKGLEGNFQVCAVGTLREARHELGKGTYSLVILDVNMPDGCGFKFFEEMRRNKNFTDLPVIFLTVEASLPDKLKAFSLGARDYLVKPFEPMELRARALARVRKTRSKSSNKVEFSKGGLRFDPPLLRVYGRDKEGGFRDLLLTLAEFKLLYALAKREGETLVHAELLETIRRGDSPATHKCLYIQISLLRKKMAEYSHMVESVPRVGYRFNSNAKRGWKAGEED
jgi:DNA-binding response OmpR family regulator